MTAPAPPGPNRTPRSRRRRWPWVVAALAAAMVVLFVFAVVALVAWIKLNDRPAAVSPSFRVPSSIPRASDPLALGHLAFDADRTGHFEVYEMALDGSAARALTTDPAYDSWWPRLSPDRRTIVFYRTPAGTHDRDFAVTSLWAIGADGSGLVELRPAGLDGWVQQGHAEWSPDGASLVMFGGSRTSPQIHITDQLGQHPRAITDRPGSNLDPAFSPDGERVAFVGCPQAVCTPGSYEIYTIGVDGRDERRVTNDDLRDQDPYYSPDGTRLAWLTQTVGGVIGEWDIRVAGVDGGDPRRLVGDDGITSRPQWSADGRTIYAHRIAPGETTFQLVAIPAAGGPPHAITREGNNEYPSP